MRAVVLKGTRQEIADGVAGINGDVLEAIVFVVDPVPAQPSHDAPTDPFAEMEQYMVDVPDADDSRASIYTRMDGE